MQSEPLNLKLAAAGGRDFEVLSRSDCDVQLHMACS